MKVSEFSEFNLHPALVQAVTDLGYTEPTPIQTATIPLLLNGRDILGQAQTGTGKTAAFALPILHNLQPGGRGAVQALVVAPTRELALQVAGAISKYGSRLSVRVLAVYGGQPYGPQIGRLRQGVDVVVGTPGRLLDLLRRNAMDLSQVRTVVLDEADEMLSMGFIEDMEAILQATPDSRQTALFSATLPPQIRRLADRYMRSPQSIAMERKDLTLAAVEQRAYLLNESDKLAALTRIWEAEEVSRAILFVRTRQASAELANELTLRGFPAEALNGEMTQGAREGVLNRFRRDQLKVLVATDVAARGLDIDDVSHVINFDLPQDPEVYVHRIGRTGRAGKSGVAITLVTPRERWLLSRIESMIKRKISLATLPTDVEIQQIREERLLAQVEIWLRRGRCARERELVTDLVEAGHDPIDIAAVALKMARAEEKQRPLEPMNPVQEIPASNRAPARGRSNGFSSQPGRDGRGTPRPREEGMVRLALSAGKREGIQVSEVVATLARQTGIPGATIGKIRIQDDRTLVDVPAEYVRQALATAGTYRIRKDLVQIELL